MENSTSFSKTVGAKTRVFVGAKTYKSGGTKPETNRETFGLGFFYKTEMKIWAVGCGLGWTVLKKVWVDCEQLLREVISTFCGQKKIFFLKTL